MDESDNWMGLVAKRTYRHVFVFSSRRLEEKPTRHHLPPTLSRIKK
jgi:hypothetical protein